MSAFEDSAGKINSDLFYDILQPFCGHQRAEVKKGPRFGMDTSVIDLGNSNGLAVSSDPLSLIPPLGLKESAWLSVHLLANDMATTGQSPQYAQFVLNLPVELSQGQFETYWKHIHTFCDEIGVAITGGHTAQVRAQESTIAGGGTMFLQAPIDEIITSDGAEPGDVIVVTKKSALVSTSILAKSFPEMVQNELGKDLFKQACDNFWQTSSLQDGLAAAECLKPRTELKAMHDVTEGGLIGAIAEMAEASGCSYTVDSDKLPVGKAQLGITQLFEIDHRFCTGAGSMTLAVQQGKEDELVAYLNNHSISASVVGVMKDDNDDDMIIEGGTKKPFNYDGRDPYWNAFYNAMEKGWT